MKNRLHRSTLGILTTITLSLSLAHGQTTGNWNTTGTTGLSWNTTSSWTGLTGGAVPNAVGATPNFTFNLTSAKTITVDNDKTMGALTIGDPTSTYYAYTLNAGTPATSRLVFDQTGVANATLTVQPAASTAANVINAGILLNDNLVINTLPTSVSVVALALGGVIDDGSGSFSVTKTGPSIITMNGANTYDGGTTIASGRIGAGNASSFGTGPVTIQSTGAGAAGGQAYLSVSAAPYTNAFTVNGIGFTESVGNIGAIRFQGATTTGTITVATDARLGAYNSAFGNINGPLVGSSAVALELNSSLTSHNGTFNLNGSAAGFLGQMTLSQGRLNLGALSSPGGSLAVKDGANLAGETTVAGNLTLGNTGSTTTGPTLYIDPATSDSLHTNGNLTLNGKTTVGLTGPVTGSSVKVLSYSGTLTGTAANLDLVGGLAAYRTGSGFDFSVANEINLTLVTGDVTWTGAASGNWNATEVNWHDGTNPTTFFNLDNVTFNDTAATKAAFTTNLANALQNDLVFTAVASGAAGEAVMIEYIDPFLGNSPIGVTVVGSTITVSLGTDPLGAIISTANDVKAAIEASVPASALITVALAAGNDGTGLVGGMSATALALANPTINLASGTTVAPGDMTFDSTAIDYTVSGAGTIGGGGTLTKAGSGLLTLSTANTFTGEVTVNGGVLKLNNAGALGGAGTKVVTVNSGGRLDFNGISPGASRGYTYKIAGTGGGLGALHNSAAAGPASNAGIFNLELLADATVGGSQAAGRFDLGFTNGVSGVIIGNNHKLTKVGLNQMNLRGDASGTPIQIDVQEGSLIAENHNNALGGATGSVTVASGATLGSYGALTLATPITLSSGASLTSLNLTGTWTGPVTLDGDAKISLAGTGVTVQGNVGQIVDSRLELLNTSTSVNSVITLSGSNTYSGGTTVKGVIATATSNGAFGTGEVVVQSNGTAAVVSRVELGTNVVLPVANSFVLDSDATTGVSAITSYAGDAVTPSTAIVNGPVEILKKVGGGGHFASTKGSASVLRVMGPVTSPNGVSVVIRQGTVELGGGGDYAGIEIVDGLLKLAANDGLCPTSILSIGTSGTVGDTATFNLNGFNQTLGGLLTGARPATVTNTGGVASNLTLNMPTSGTFSGVFSDGGSALSLTKTGAGTLTLSGVSSSFTGSLLVTGGGLNLTGTLGAPGASAAFDPGTTLSGEGTFGGDLVLTGATLSVNGSTPLGVFASGNVNATSGVLVDLKSLPTTAGPMEIIAYGGTLTGSASNFSLVGAANYRSPVFSVAANAVNLTLGLPVDLTWTGTGGSDWDVGTTSNWNDPLMAASKFLYADNVTFGNTGGGTIGVPANVNASKLVINSNDNWLFQGVGTVSASEVTKDGTGSATFECPVNFPGTITLTNGALRVSPPASTTTIFPGLVSGAGVLAKGGDGILSIPGANPGFTGTMAISKGELIPGNNAAFGTAKLALGDATTVPGDICTLTLNTGVVLATSQVEVSETCADARILGIGGSITGTTITKRGTGKLTIGHPTDYTQSATYIAGTSALVIEKGSVAFGSRTALATNTAVTLGNENSGNADTVLELPRANGGDQVVLTPALVLGTLAPGSTSQAIVRYTGASLGSNSTNGAPSITGTVNLNGRDLYIENVSHQTGGVTRLANFQSVISGTGNVHIRCGTNADGSASGGPRFRIQNTSNSWVGDLYIDTGYLQIGFTNECIPNNALLIMSAGTAMGMGNTSETIRGLRGGAPTEAVPFTARLESNTGNSNITRIILSDANPANTHIYDGTIVSNMALTKAGEATQVINGACTFTSTTLLNAGKLILNNAYASAITVAAGATLGGNMTSTAAVTATASGAKIAPGNSTGTMTAASIALGTGSVLEMEIDDTSTPKNDKLVATGALTVTGATLNLTTIGSPTQPVYVLASYGSLTGTFATVTGKPAAYDLVYNYNDGVSSNNIALVQNDPYIGWLAAYPALTGANRAPDVDFDNDGLDNGVEFVIGSDPTAVTTTGLPTAALAGGNLVFNFKRSDASESYAVTVETSTDLVAWPTSYAIPTVATTGPPVTVVDNGPTTLDDVSVTIPMAPDANKYARLKVAIPFVP